MRFADSAAEPVFCPRPLAGWARPKGASLQDLDAGFLAGASLAHLDAIMRSDAACLGAWRHRLALTAAAASVKMIGRREDAGELRDAWFLRRPGADLGPAGGHLLAWRNLVRSSPDLSSDAIRRAAEAFGLNATELPADISTRVAEASRENRGALQAAAHVAAEVARLCPPAELLGYWLADLTLAARLRWPFPLPLLITRIASHAARTGARARSPRPIGPEWEKLVAIAYAQAAAAAIDLAGELFRRATTLTAVAPTLRAKGAAIVVQNLLDDDALAPSSRLGGMSDRGMRRLCDRLVELGGARELTNRASFRLYGL